MISICLAGPFPGGVGKVLWAIAAAPRLFAGPAAKLTPKQSTCHSLCLFAVLHLTTALIDAVSLRSTDLFLIPGCRNKINFTQKEKLKMTTKSATQTQQPKPETPTRKPIHEIRLSRVKAAVWQNTTDNGVFYNVTFSRLYRDGDQWKSSDSFGRDELPLLASVANQAWQWILQKQHEQD